MYDKASDLYNDLLGSYSNEYNELSDAKREKKSSNMILLNDFLKQLIIMSGFKMKNQLIKKN